MKRTVTEILNARKSTIPHVIETSVEIPKNSISGQKFIQNLSSGAENAQNLTHKFDDIKLSKTVLQDFSDDKLKTFSCSHRESKGNVSMQNSVFDEQKEFRDALIRFEYSNQIDSFFLSRSIANFYSFEDSGSNQVRGARYDIKCKMFEKSFSENEALYHKAGITAEALADNIIIPITNYPPKVVLHSFLSDVDVNSYKNAHEIVSARIISSETGNEIFVTADCDRNDFELEAWIGDLPVRYENISVPNQTNFDFYQKVTLSDGSRIVIRGELKHRSSSLVLNKNAHDVCLNDKPLDLYISVGPISDEDRKRVMDNLVKAKESKNARLGLNSTSSDDEMQKIKDYAATSDLEKIKTVQSVLKIIFNTHVEARRSQGYKSIEKEEENDGYDID